MKILASDIDTDVLQEAESGVYASERLEGMPDALKQKYFLRGSGTNAGLVQVVPELRSLIAFRRINLMEEPWPIHTRFDGIFCRNVIIYFNRETQAKLFERMAAQLYEGGCLFLGHSENLHGGTPLFVPLGNTIYRRVGRGQTPKGSWRVNWAKLNSPAQGASKTAAAAARPPKAHAPRERTAPVLKTATIIVGGVFASREPAVVTTLLGSCIAACLFDPVAGVGGMNHFLLPGTVGQTEGCTRYGVHAMELLINDIMKLGGDRRRLKAKVFGGAQVMN